VVIDDIAAYVGVLLINVFGALTYLIASVHNGIDNQSGTTFGMAIVCAILYTPCSFVCWFRPVYNAFKYALHTDVLYLHINMLWLLYLNVDSDLKFIMYYYFVEFRTHSPP